MLTLNDINEKPPEHLEKIKSFAYKPLGFFLLSGLNGRGKSFIAEVIYQMHTPHVLPRLDYDLAIFINQADLNADFIQKSTENNYYMQKYDAHKLKKTKLFVLDDLGTREPSVAFLDFLYSVFDHRWRYRHELGTIITTNLNSAQIRDKFGDAVFSRIASGIVLKTEGDGYKDRRFNEF